MSARSHRQTIAAALATLAAGVSLYPLFLGTNWFWAGVGAIVTVALAGTLTRLRRLPLLACFTVGLLVLVCYLNLVFEAGHSFGHVLPTLRSLEDLGRLARTGVDQSAKYAPPAPELPGIVLLGAGGIGIVALLVDFTAVRLRSAALAGAPLLLLVTEPFAVSAARGGLETVGAFCLATIGYLAMLSTESRERIREWEAPRPGESAAPDMSMLASTGRRVGAVAVAIALFLPLFVPGLHVTRLLGGQPGIGGNPGDGPGYAGGTGFPSPQTAVSSQLQDPANTPVLEYTQGAIVGPRRRQRARCRRSTCSCTSWTSSPPRASSWPRITPPCPYRGSARRFQGHLGCRATRFRRALLPSGHWRPRPSGSTPGSWRKPG